MTLWVPNWSSTAVVWGIARPWPSGMIAGRDGTTALSRVSATRGVARVAGPQFQIEETRRSWCCAMKPPC
jgi:hypothetical protein